MAKVTFSSLKFKTNDAVNTFKVGDATIEVKQYLPIEDKRDLIDIALQKSEDNGIYNEAALEVFLNLNIVYLYTNLSFTEKQREDEFALYDKLQSNGFISAVIEHMDKLEYNQLLDYFNSIRTTRETYRSSAAAVIKDFLRDVPIQMQSAVEAINQMNPEQFAAVRDMVNLADKSGMNNGLSLAK